MHRSVVNSSVSSPSSVALPDPTSKASSSAKSPSVVIGSSLGGAAFFILLSLTLYLLLRKWRKKSVNSNNPTESSTSREIPEQMEAYVPGRLPGTTFRGLLDELVNGDKGVEVPSTSSTTVVEPPPQYQQRC